METAAFVAVIDAGKQRHTPVFVAPRLWKSIWRKILYLGAGLSSAAETHLTCYGQEKNKRVKFQALGCWVWFCSSGIHSQPEGSNLPQGLVISRCGDCQETASWELNILTRKPLSSQMQGGFVFRETWTFSRQQNPPVEGFRVAQGKARAA